MTPPPSHTPVTRVLIVEDEPEFLRRFSEAVLVDDALSLTAAVSTAAAALAVMAATPPDVVLLDLGLPDRNGIEVIQEVARRWPACEVLVVTMFGDDDHVFEALAAGASGYLLKDFRMERIAASIHDLRAGGAPITPSIARRVLARMRGTQDAGPAAGSTTGPHTSSAAREQSGDDPGDSGGPGATTPINWRRRAGDAPPDADGASSLLGSAGSEGSGRPDDPLSRAGFTRGDASEAPGSEPAGSDAVLTPREIELLKLTAKGLSFDTVAELLGISPHTVVAHVKKIYRKLAVHSRGEAVYEATQMGLL